MTRIATGRIRPDEIRPRAPLILPVPQCFTPPTGSPGFSPAGPVAGRVPVLACRASGTVSGFWCRTWIVSLPSVISRNRSAARSLKVWVVPVAGQVTVRLATEEASARPMSSTRLLPPKLPLLPTVGGSTRACRPGPSRSASILAPRAARLVLVPTSLTFSQCGRGPGCWNRSVVGPVARHPPRRHDEEVEVAVAVPVGERDAVALLEVPGAGGVGHVLELRPPTFLNIRLGIEARERHASRCRSRGRGSRRCRCRRIEPIGGDRRSRPTSGHVAEALRPGCGRAGGGSTGSVLQAQVTWRRSRPAMAL